MDEAEMVERLALEEAEKDLTPREFFIIHARYYGGWTQSEVAVALGICRQNVTRREKQTLAKLRRILENQN